MSAPTTPTPARSRSNSDLSGNPIKKFNNGWTKQQETLMAEWSDKAGCYRWLHDRCEKKYSMMNMWITIPVIILSTLTGTANFALDGFIPPEDEDAKKYAQAAIGGVSIFAGILTTLGNFLRFAQGSESHRVAGIAWGKFQRQIAVELAIAPKDRIDCMDFLKICRAELDRLIEQSPPVPDDVIAEFKKEFEDKPTVKKPEICDGMEHTTVYENRESVLKQITAEATIALYHKKRLLREEIIPDLNKLISKEVNKQVSDLSGTILDVNSRKKDFYDTISSRRGSLTNALSRAIGKSMKHGDGNWKRNGRSVSPPKTEERQNTVSDVHIEIVGQETLETQTNTQSNTQAEGKNDMHYA
jgi:hypothetical protein